MSKIFNIDYEKYKLENGLDVILYNNTSFPLAAVNIWYNVGSANEQNDKTGFAHLFEHMMFQGSENVPKEMHFKYIQEVGGSLNGSTNMDRTNYYETVPADSLELALWLESDRMGYLLPSLTQEKLDNQKSVVMNERRQNYDNQPYGLAWELLFSNLFPKQHPYHWPTIGWMKDIASFEMDDVKEFFRKYYSPNNASLVIGGTFNKDKAKELVEKYFAPIPKGKDIDRLKTNKVNLTENKTIVHKDNVNLPKLYLAWHSNKAYDSDDAALDILADILSASKTSRLYKSLVHDLQIANNVSAFQYSGKYAGVFFIIVTLKPNVETDDVKMNILKILKDLSKEGITENELKRAVTGFKSSYIYSLQNLSNVVNQINNYNCSLNEPNSFLYDINRYETLTTKDIKNVVEKYLDKPYVQLSIIADK